MGAPIGAFVGDLKPLNGLLFDYHLTPEEASDAQKMAAYCSRHVYSVYHICVLATQQNADKGQFTHVVSNHSNTW